MSQRRLRAVENEPEPGDDTPGARRSKRAMVSFNPDAPLGGGTHAPTRAADLIHRTALGDTDAFVELFDVFSTRVYGIAHKVVRDPHQAEEVAQDVFVEIWRRASRFDPDRGSASAWIMTIAHGRAVDRVRRAQSAADREHRAGAAAAERDIDPVQDQAEQRWERAAVRHCLEALTDLQRESVSLAYYSGYTYPEVASLLHKPLATIKTRMRDGLIRLRDCLAVAR